MSAIFRRLERLRRLMEQKSAEAALISDVTNVRYLTGFTGDDSALVVSRRDAHFVTDFRFTEQARSELRGTNIAIIQRKKSLLETVALLLRKLGAKAVAFEPEAMSVQAYDELKGKLCPKVALKPVARLVSSLRERKDADEVAKIRKALAIAEEAFREVFRMLRPGMSEHEVAVELEFRMKRQGAMAASFPIIVAGGPRASLPHARPTQRALRAGEPIVIDWGAVVDFYCSDLTRTVFLGNIPTHWRRKYKLVLQAQRRGIAAVAAKAEAAHVDGAARAYLRKHRLAKRFGHGLGHGVGMAVHEAPRLGQGCLNKLQPGMIVTVEPGVYLPGEGGIRIEDMVLVRCDGAEVLSALPKDVDSIVV